MYIMNRKKIFALIFILITIITNTLGVYAENTYTKSFILGRSDIISENITNDTFKDAKEIIIVSKKAIVDAISVTPLAYLKDSPVLIGDWMSLPNGTKRILKQSSVEKVTIIGGLSLISGTLEQELKDLGFVVERIDGENRFETSMKIANEMKKIKNFSEAFFIDYSLGLENALSIYSYAAENNIPIIWRDDLPEAKKNTTLNKTINYLKKNDLDKVYVIGDSQSARSFIQSNLDNVEFIDEINHRKTNIDILRKFYNLDEISNMYAIKVNFGGSIAAEYFSLGVVSAKQGAPILICGDKLTYEQDKFLKENKVKRLTQVGTKISDFNMKDLLPKFIPSIILVFSLIFITFRAIKYEA